MSTETKEEVQELVVLTPEQIEELPTTVKENVVFLTEKVGTSDLMELNPMVSELIEIREQGKGLIFAGTNDAGEYSKSNIQDFVDVKKRIRTFRAKVGKVAKILKVEPTKINKAIIAIEKAFIAEATAVYDNAEKLFEPYIMAEEEKALAKQKAKDQALLDKIAEEKAGKDEAEEKLAKSNLYNKIKYELITGLITEKVSEAISLGSEQHVQDIKARIDSYSYELITTGVDDSILDEDVVGELKHFYVNAKQKALVMINGRLDAFAKERENIILESNQRPFEADVIIGKPDVIPATTNQIQSNKEFSDYIIAEGKRLLSLTNDRLDGDVYCTPNIYHLRTILYQFNDL
jgi:hypothetical protein